MADPNDSVSVTGSLNDDKEFLKELTDEQIEAKINEIL